MVLRILQLFLILAVIRAAWRLFKGVLEGAGYQRIDTQAKPTVKLQRDPVCGSFVSPVTAPTLQASGKTIYFCSEKCLREWKAR